jgi:hypothetical protein
VLRSGAQRYGEMDERMSRKRPYRYSESGVMVQYIPHRVGLKPNRSRACPPAWPKGHTFKRVMSPVSVRYVLASDPLPLFFFFFCTSQYVLTSWMTCTHTKSRTNDTSKMIMITQGQRVERERGESVHQLTTAKVGQWSVSDARPLIVRFAT